MSVVATFVIRKALRLSVALSVIFTGSLLCALIPGNKAAVHIAQTTCLHPPITTATQSPPQPTSPHATLPCCPLPALEPAPGLSKHPHRACCAGGKLELSGHELTTHGCPGACRCMDYVFAFGGQSAGALHTNVSLFLLALPAGSYRAQRAWRRGAMLQHQQLQQQALAMMMCRAQC
jgi:hypothetical protein